MRECFREQRFHGRSEELMKLADEIVTDYEERLNLRMTVRQVYYQIIRRALEWFPNSIKSYRMLSNLVNNGRLAGRLDWDNIEDRTRVPRRAAEFNNLDECLKDSIDNFRLKRWQDQKCYVEIWVEKDALSGVLSPIAHEYHVILMANKGYTSQSAMYEASKRFINAEASDKRGVVLYIGDHDPSGVDMVRDIQDRFAMFGATVEVQKIALTYEQIKQYKPPPNPVGIRPGKGRPDPRMLDYVRQFGKRSWEVDALDPEVLTKITTDALDPLIDRPLYDAKIAQEKADLEQIKSFLKDPNAFTGEADRKLIVDLTAEQERLRTRETENEAEIGKWIAAFEKLKAKKPPRCRRKHVPKPKKG